jgi:hypothetical protein
MWKVVDESSELQVAQPERGEIDLLGSSEEAVNEVLQETRLVQCAAVTR